jgi:ATP-dependent Zn protease
VFNDKNLLNATKGAEIEEVKASFEKAKKDETISILDNENKINKNTIEEKEIKVQEKNVLLLGLFSVIGFLILLGIFGIFWSQKNSHNYSIPS